MEKELISKKTRNELREYFVGRTLREIEMEFDAVDIACDCAYQPGISGQRRTLVEQYYNTLDFTKASDVKKFIKVYENTLNYLEQQVEGQSAFSDAAWTENNFNNLKKWIKKDGFIYQNGVLVSTNRNPAFDMTADTLNSLDSDYISNQLQRINDSIQDDPTLAIGTSKELIESVCKTILDERNIQYDRNDDIMDLVKKTRKVLKLLPDDIPDSAKGAEAIRKLLSSLGNIAHIIAELRNQYGTGHGKSAKSKGLSARHAKLVVGSTATLVTFLFETHKERQ